MIMPSSAPLFVPPLQQQQFREMSVPAMLPHASVMSVGISSEESVGEMISIVAILCLNNVQNKLSFIQHTGIQTLMPFIQ